MARKSVSPDVHKWPLVSLIIVNWNGLTLLKEYLPSILATDYPNYEVIIVDNGSTDGSIDYVTQNFEIKVIANTRNLGFAGGNNVGLKAASGEICVLLNTDVAVRSTWLKELVTAIQSNPQAGIAGCKILFPDGKTLQHAGAKLQYPSADPYHYGFGEKDRGQFEEVREVEYVTGAAMAIKAETLAKVGYLDETFFPAYYEETDYCVRARQQGYKIIYVPGSVVIHHQSATAGKNNPLRLRAFHTNRLRFVLKHYPVHSFLGDFVQSELSRIRQEASVEEVRAMRQAYLEILFALPDILRQRQELARLEDFQAAIVQFRKAVLARPAAARNSATDGWPHEELVARHVLHEFRFQSEAPVIGPFIAAFREFWNGISTRWYVKSIIREQTTFNRLVAKSLEKQSQFVYELDHTEEAEVLAGEIISLRGQFRELALDLQRELSACQHRLDRLEKIVASWEETEAKRTVRQG